MLSPIWTKQIGAVPTIIDLYRSSRFSEAIRGCSQQFIHTVSILVLSQVTLIHGKDALVQWLENGGNMMNEHHK